MEDYEFDGNQKANNLNEERIFISHFNLYG